MWNEHFARERGEIFERGPFRGGDEGGWLSRNVARLLTQAFDTVLYKQIQTQVPISSPDVTYISNESFWLDALQGRHIHSMTMALQGFHLTEWLPSAPGRYFTPQASENRESATRFFDERLEEYQPAGKGSMILGGIGSLRLGIQRAEGETFYLLGASSTGISHEGIPVALQKSMYKTIARQLHLYGGCLTNLVGNLQILPESTQATRRISYGEAIPKYCFIVDDIEIIRPSKIGELLITIAIAFAVDKSNTYKSYSYCSFRPGFQNFSRRPGSQNLSLKYAVAWLKDYTKRYSSLSNPPILCDFDDHYAHFENPVEFPLAQIQRQDVDIFLLKDYQEQWNLTINKHALSEPLSRLLESKPTPTNIFLCYAPEDRQLVEQFKKHLSPLQRQQFIIWLQEQDLLAGKHVQQNSQALIQSADIILLFISADFMSSHFSDSEYMTQIEERHARGEVEVFPVLLRPALWQDDQFLGSLKPLPADATPLTDISSRTLEDGFFQLAQDIKELVRKRLAIG